MDLRKFLSREGRGAQPSGARPSEQNATAGAPPDAAQTPAPKTQAADAGASDSRPKPKRQIPKGTHVTRQISGCQALIAKYHRDIIAAAYDPNARPATLADNFSLLLEVTFDRRLTDDEMTVLWEAFIAAVLARFRSTRFTGADGKPLSGKEANARRLAMIEEFLNSFDPNEHPHASTSAARRLYVGVLAEFMVHEFNAGRLRVELPKKVEEPVEDPDGSSAEMEAIRDADPPPRRGGGTPIYGPDTDGDIRLDEDPPSGDAGDSTAGHPAILGPGDAPRPRQPSGASGAPDGLQK